MPPRRFLLALLLTLLVRDAYASRMVDNLKAGIPQVVVMYGTSLTAGGQWVADTRDWLSGFNPGFVTVVNAGMSGKASGTGVSNLQSRVLSYGPDAVFIEFAINDAASYSSGDIDYGITPEKSRANLNAMIDAILAERPACEIFLQTMNPAWDAPNGNQSSSRRPRLAEYYEGYRQVAAERGLLLIDHNANWIGLRTENLSQFQNYIPDGVHPSAAGSTAITSPEIRRRLEVLVAVPAAPSSLTAVAAPGEVTLAWPRVTDAFTYAVKRAGSAGGPYVLIADGLSAPGYVDAGLVNGATYHYAVSASNAAGEGPPSAAISATPQAAGVAIIKDNADGAGVLFAGGWTIGTGFPGFYGTNYAYATGGTSATARFTPTIPSAGLYAVHARWNASVNRATNSPFTVVHANGSVTVPVNQQINHATWVLLGAHVFNAGVSGHVLLGAAGANGLVLADAVRFTPLTPPGVAVAAQRASVREDAGETVRFTFTRRDTNQEALTIFYELSGAATPGVDYQGGGGSMIIPVGASSASVVLTPLADSASEGDEAVVLTVTPHVSYSVETLAGARTTLKDRPMDEWRFGCFSAAQRSDPAISGDTADPDHDGAPNLLEYALGTDPVRANSAPLTVAIVDGHLTLTYRRRAPGAGVDYLAEVSSDLLHWTAGSVAVDDTFLEDLGNGFSINEARDIAPAASASARYLRLRVAPTP